MGPPSIFHFLLFSALGSGPSWVMSGTLMQELPYFQQHQPEGLCLASRLCLCANSGLVIAFAYYLYNRYVHVVSNLVAIPSLILFVSMTMILCSILYPVTIFDMSIPLYLCMFCAGCVGNLMYQVLYPFLVQYSEEYMIAARAGNDFTNAVIAFFALYQNPGSSSINISPSVFILSIALYLLVFPISAFFYIVNNGIGLKDGENKIKIVDEFGNQVDIEEYEIVKSMDYLDVTTDEKVESSYDLGQNRHDFNEKLTSRQSYGSNVAIDNAVSLRHVISKGQVCIDLEDPVYIIPRTISFIPEQVFLVLCVVWVDFNNWGFLSNFVPYAMQYSTKSTEEASILLSYALQLSSLSLVIGDLSTYFFKIPILLCLLGFTTIASLIYFAAMGTGLFYNNGYILVILFGIGRFLEAHMSTSVFNYISGSFPGSMKEDAIRFLGLADMIAVTAGTIISAAIINSDFTCTITTPIGSAGDS